MKNRTLLGGVFLLGVIAGLLQRKAGPQGIPGPRGFQGPAGMRGEQGPPRITLQDLWDGGPLSVTHRNPPK